ncbi:MAG: glycosyltransferase family 39 protein [Gloeotrichia echinulata DVL01]
MLFRRKFQFLTSDRAILIMLWIAAFVCDRLWATLDNSPPAWDTGDHLTRAANYWGMLSHPQFFSGDWWTKLWQLSPSYRAPFVYLMTVPFFTLFGCSFESGTLVNVLFTAIILIFVYQLGKHIFSANVGLWAAGLCILVHSFVLIRLDYLLEYGLTATLIFAFTSLTFWRDADSPKKQWFWSVCFGVGAGITVLSKPSGLIFLLIPSVWVLGENILSKNWRRIAQLVVAFLIAVMVLYPWVSVNWLTILTSSENNNNYGLKYANSPQANSLEGWVYYLSVLPDMIYPPLLYMCLGSGILGAATWLVKGKRSPAESVTKKSTWRWLLIFCLGTYFLFSFLSNKDFRFILPYLPVVLVLLARLLTISSTIWSQWLRWVTVAITSLFLISDLFPIPFLQQFSGRHLPYLGATYPHAEVIAEVIQKQPYLRSNMGIVPNTVQINPFNLDFFGSAANFQVFARQIGTNIKNIPQDARSLNWYITKTGDQGAIGGFEAAQAALNTTVTQSPDLKIQKTWNLPDKSELRLYQRRVSPVVVEKLNSTPPPQVSLGVLTSVQAPPGKPIPVQYEFTGSWEQLQDGLVLLTWQGQGNQRWLHDHAIALGQLYTKTEAPPANTAFRVIETLAMLPPAELSAGTYNLKAIYLNRRTGNTYPLPTPPIQITLNPQAANIPAPELDLITQLEQLATGLPQGKLDPIFREIARINQYDPLQDYLNYAEIALSYRLSQEPKNLDIAYSLALSQTLQRRVEPLLKTLDKITQQDAQNAYAWTYLGFVHLYNFQPKAAESALQVAEKLNSKIPEVKSLRIVSSAMQFNFLQAWERYKLAK